MKETQPISPNKPFERKDLSTPAGSDVVELCRQDHVALKNLIQVLKKTALSRDAKAQPCEEFIFNLMRHAKAEEQSLYLHMKEYKSLKTESYEGDTEHAIADQLIQEINATADDYEWNAKVKVLAELVEHHIEEEEAKDGLFAHVKEKWTSDELKKVGAEYERIKKEFETTNEVRAPRNIKFNERSVHHH